MSQTIFLIPTSGPGSGTVTSISAATGITLTPNPITSTGTVGLTIPVVVTSGGTGFITATTAYAPIVAGTTPTAPFQVASTGLATSGFVLTSNGNAAVPSFQAPAASSISITGDSGGALTGSAFTFAGGTTGLSFGGAGSTETLTFAGITANGGTVSLATDATASTINIGTGAGVKNTTLGSTNTTSATVIKSGSGNVAINTGLTVDSTGRNYNTKQPAFFFYQNSATANNVTGDGTQYTIGSSVALTQYTQQGSGMTTGGTFTAPIAGYYMFNLLVRFANIGAATSVQLSMISSDTGTIRGPLIAPASLGNFTTSFTQLFLMSAGGTVTFAAVASGTTKTVGIDGNGAPLTNTITGALIC